MAMWWHVNIGLLLLAAELLLFCSTRSVTPQQRASNLMRMHVDAPAVYEECTGEIVESMAKSVSIRIDVSTDDKVPCMWLLRADPGNVFEFHVTEVRLKCRQGEYLNMYDGAGTDVPLLLQFCQITRSSATRMYVSSSDAVYIELVAGNEAKLIVDIEQIPYVAPSPGTDPCHGTGEILSGSGGTTESQGYMTDDTGHYGNGADCTWHIQVEQQQIVRLVFSAFDVEYESTCQYDALRVYDGPKNDSRLIGRYCGKLDSLSLKSETNEITLHFTSDYMISRNGFRFTWAAVDKNASGTVAAECNGTSSLLEGSTGLLGHDAGHQYAPNENCSWLIQTEGEHVMLWLLRLDIEPSGECVYDRLILYDGASEQDALLAGPLCGADAIDVIFSTSGSVLVRFESDDTGQQSGFSLEYIAVANASDPCSDGGVNVTMDQAGALLSPSYLTDGYPNDARCSWTVSTIGEQALLKFVGFDMEPHSFCKYDSLSVYDGTSSSSPLLGKFCGSNLPHDVKASGPVLTIELVSDYSVSGKGFGAVVSAGHVTQSVNATDCDNITLSGESGELSSPAFGGTNKYASNLNCSWTIRVQPGKGINLTFVEFDLEDSYRCSADYVKIATPTTYGMCHCGQIKDFGMIQHEDVVILQFVSDRSVQARGFLVSWQQVDIQKQAMCGVPGNTYNIKTINNTNQAKVKIIGGGVASAYSLPWQISMYRSGKFTCGGSIIHNEWILTAAHCVHGQTAEKMAILAGDYALDVAEPQEQYRQVHEIHMHPGYDPVTTDKDVALLRLRPPLRISEHVKPICLSRSDPEPDTMCLTSGWGIIDTGTVAKYLRQVYLPILPAFTCKASYDPTPITDYMVCAGFYFGGHDACSGDSGGPLICPSVNDNGTWELHGVTSWGEGCALPGKPGVWARVTRFLDWIEDVTNNRVYYSDE